MFLNFLEQINYNNETLNVIIIIIIIINRDHRRVSYSYVCTEHEAMLI